VDRLACVDVPALPLQLLLRRHPEWAGPPALPAAVVAEDRPQGVLLWVNGEARARRVLPGLRYAAALSLAPELRAGVVAPAAIETGVHEIAGRLRKFTPRVEPAPAAAAEPGVFWLDASGLGRLYASLAEWARWVRADLSDAGLRAAVVVGFSRFGTYAVAKALGAAVRADAGAAPRDAVIVYDDASREEAAARRVPLDRLDLEPAVRDALDKLGVRAVGALLKLPAAGLYERFGAQVHRLHRLAAGTLRPPLQPRRPEEPPEARIDMDFPETDATRMLFLVKRLLHGLLDALASRGEALAELLVRRTLERPREERADAIKPAAPTLDEAQLVDLVRLRFEADALPSGIVALALTARGVRATREQIRMFAQKPRRDVEAADRALARLRAELGPDAVVRARLRDGHLPEAQFAWEPLEHVAPPSARAPAAALSTGAPAPPRPLVRRIHARPLALPPRPRHEPDGWLVRGIAGGPVVRLHGPFVVRGGWWNGDEVHREYHFAETQAGDLLWIFYDRKRRQWFLHGEIQ
jgi:protein ImuB